MDRGEEGDMAGEFAENKGHGLSDWLCLVGGPTSDDRWKD
jgi:hypothetical protein